MQTCSLADQFEVVDIDTENEFKLPVVEKAFPSGDRLNIALQKLFGEVILPLFATHWVAIQTQT